MAEQKQRTSGTLPKNIRQIGISTGSTRVYLEDYVYTYLHTQEVQETWTNRGFMLLGRVEKGKDYTRYFISGLIRIEDEFFKEHILEFSDDTWAFIYKEMKTFYDNLEIVGWGQDVSNASSGLTAELEQNHKKNFNIQKNVLFLLDQVENEEAFYVFDKNVLQRKEGYYVYYEKNPQMQEYMIEKNKNRELDISPDEIQEPLVHSYREMLLEKKAQLSERKWNGVLYTTSLLLVLSVCVLGVSTVNNVEKMKDLESAVNQISGHGGQSGVKSSDVPVMSANVQDENQADLNEAGNKKNSGDKKTEDGSAKKNGQSEKDTSEKNGQSADDQTEASGENGQSGEDITGKDGQAGSAVQSGNGKQAKDIQTKNSGQENAGSGSGGQAGSGDSGSSGQSGKDGQSDGSSGKNASKDQKEGTGSSGEQDSAQTSALTEAQTSLLQGYYIVKKGESLVGISKKIYGTSAKARKICELNGIEDMDMIYAGQKLELP